LLLPQPSLADVSVSSSAGLSSRHLSRANLLPRNTIIGSKNRVQQHRHRRLEDGAGCSTMGIVDSLARPGGNAAGFFATEPSLGGKWLELLKEIVPGLRRVAVRLRGQKSFFDL
jgi:hypothetical protein